MTDLVTLDDFKEYKGINSTNNDGRYQTLITQASALVENYCNRTFLDYYSSPFKTEWFDAKTTEVQLSEFPLVAVQSVYTSVDGGITQVLLNEADSSGTGYFVDLDAGVVRTQKTKTKFLDSYNTPYRSLEVTYQAGYEEIPADLKLCIYDLVEYYKDEQAHPTKSMLGATIENPIGSMNSFPPHIRRILDLYRIA